MVDLGQQIDEFGVDAVRLTMVFAGPAEDDIDWADVSPAGSRKFLARVWRLAVDVQNAGTHAIVQRGADGDTAAGDTPAAALASTDTAADATAAVELRKATHRTIRDATSALDSFRFNVMIARLMELTNATRKAIDGALGPSHPAVREAVENLGIMLSLVAPYTAEDMWARLGHEPTVALAGWPVADAALIAEETVTCVVQVGGKVRARLEVPPNIAEPDLIAQVMADPAVKAALGGRPPSRTVVKPPKLVNLVP
jgi:leucyl-tRNA synthetase